MQVDPRRDHSFQVPHPALATQIGAPDPCLTCHTDRTPESLDESIRTGYPRRARARSARAAPVLERLRNADQGVFDAANELLLDTSYAAITRATAAAMLDAFPIQQALGPAARSLRDPDPLVRLGVLDALDGLGPDVPPVLLTPLLADPFAVVRTEAARVLVTDGVTPDADAPPGFEEGLQAYLAAQRVNDDQAGSHVNRGVVREHLGDESSAVEAYRDALRIDSVYTPALVNLGLLYGRQATEAGTGPTGRALRDEAVACFRKAASKAGPAAARAAYYLGLLLAEESVTLDSAAVVLETAARRLETDGRAYYNAGLAFQTLGDAERAVKLLGRAGSLSPSDPDPVNALVILFIQQERWADALEANRRLEVLVPDNPAILERSAWIEARVETGRDAAPDSDG
jgi:tetratricopeptide (TPR) repeat protein